MVIGSLHNIRTKYHGSTGQRCPDHRDEKLPHGAPFTSVARNVRIVNMFLASHFPVFALQTHIVAKDFSNLNIRETAHFS